jgi:uncharacterized protein (DUF342 family)
MSATDTKKMQRVRVTVSGDGLSATLLLSRPHEEDPPITVEEARKSIEEAGVCFGVDEDAVRNCVGSGNFNRPVPIAAGRKPERGQNTEFEYHFDTSSRGKPKEGEDGRIDYKDISYIQNTKKGDVLVTKTPPTPGVPGMTVRGKELKAADGRDIPINKGSNTEVSEDELKLIATANGAIIFQHGKVAVNDLLIINGDVDHSVGNIKCTGSVRVSGAIKAGFKIEVEGDLEVNGNVEDCNIDVQGNIVVKGGFFGKGDGIMRAGGDITVKYAEGQRIVSGGGITVGGEIIKCEIFAGGDIKVEGKRGKIVGGEIKAGSSIEASVLGSEAGTRTHLHVAYHPDLMERYAQINAEMERQEADGERVKEALYVMYKLQLDGALTPQQKQAMDKLVAFKKDLPGSIETLQAEKAKVEEKLKGFQHAHIAAQTIMYPGVVAHFGIVYKDIIENHERCKLTLDNGIIMLDKLG